MVYDCQRDNRLVVCPDNKTRSDAAKEICLASLTVEDIIAGHVVSPKSHLGQVVYKSCYDKFKTGIDLTR